jgi:hypothetical protein
MTEMNEEVQEILQKPTASVPDVGRVFYGLAANASYRAAKEGEIATVRIGGRILALTAPLKKLVEA